MRMNKNRNGYMFSSATSERRHTDGHQTMSCSSRTEQERALRTDQRHSCTHTERGPEREPYRGRLLRSQQWRQIGNRDSPRKKGSSHILPNPSPSGSGGQCSSLSNQEDTGVKCEHKSVWEKWSHSSAAVKQEEVKTWFPCLDEDILD